VRAVADDLEVVVPILEQARGPSLDHELRTFGIRVSLVEPAFTRTALEENAERPDRISSVYEKGRTAMNSTWRSAIAAGDPVEAAARLFDLLHQADGSDKRRIAVAPVPNHGLGAAINDRLRRAAHR